MFQLLRNDKFVYAFRKLFRMCDVLPQNELRQRCLFSLSQRNCFFHNSNNLAWTSGAVLSHRFNCKAVSLSFPELPLVVKETAVDTFDDVVGWRRIEQLAIAAMSTAHKCFVEAGTTDVCDCFKTPIDAICVGERAGLLLSIPALVDNTHGHLPQMNSKGSYEERIR